MTRAEPLAVRKGSAPVALARGSLRQSVAFGVESGWAWPHERLLVNACHRSEEGQTIRCLGPTHSGHHHGEDTS
jgi:hypothetical protein